jgi:hypothetical protein
MRRTIQNKRCRMLTFGEVLLQDNVHPNIAARTNAMLEYFKLELFYHPPKSCNLTRSNYHLFMYLKNWLQSHFDNAELDVVKT